LPGLEMKQKRMGGIQKDNIMNNTDRKILRVVRRYLATAEDFPEIHPDYIEGAKDMIAEDIIIFERLEEYEKCSLLKKAYQKLEQLK
jgi:hypothetical protein